MKKTRGMKDVGGKFEVRITHKKKQAVVGVYENEQLAKAVLNISQIVAADTSTGAPDEIDVSVEWIEILECLGIKERLKEITGWQLDFNQAHRNEEMELDRYIQSKIDRALRFRREKAACTREYREARRLQFLTMTNDVYPPIPTWSAPATEEAIDLPEKSGVYFVWCPDARLQYVGQSVNLRSRANLKHERIELGDRVSWLEFPVMNLYFAESYYIGVGRPNLNFGSLQERHKARVCEATNGEGAENE